jgi:hypothetical protein
MKSKLNLRLRYKCSHTHTHTHYVDGRACLSVLYYSFKYFSNWKIVQVRVVYFNEPYALFHAQTLYEKSVHFSLCLMYRRCYNVPPRFKIKFSWRILLWISHFKFRRISFGVGRWHARTDECQRDKHWQTDLISHIWCLLITNFVQIMHNTFD